MKKSAILLPFLLVFINLVSCAAPVQPVQNTPVAASATQTSPSATPALIQTTAPTITPTTTGTPTPIPTAAPTLAPMGDFMKGVAFAEWDLDNYEFQSLAAMTVLDKQIKPLGTSWVSLDFHCVQSDVNSTYIYCRTEGGLDPKLDDDLAYAIRAIHQRGMRVMLKPHLDLEHDPSHWHGEIGNHFTVDEWREWFKNYTDFITHFAELAQQNNVDAFCISNELNSVYKQEKAWREVIKAVRNVYAGPVTGEVIGDEFATTWWDAVDFIAISAYIPLTDKANPQLSELKAGWQKYAVQLDALSKKWNKPIVFTEAGFRSIAGTNRGPADAGAHAELSMQEQKNCYEALFEIMTGKPWWHGVFFWEWNIDSNQGGLYDDNFTVSGKPAETVLRRYYGGDPLPVAAQPVFPPESGPERLYIYNGSLQNDWQFDKWGSPHVTDGDPKFLLNNLPSLLITFNDNQWETVHFYHDPMSTRHYQWLEFYVLSKETKYTRLTIFVSTDKNESLGGAVAFDPRYLVDGERKGKVWQRVVIPLVTLVPSGSLINSVTFNNSGDLARTYWINNVSLVGDK